MSGEEAARTVELGRVSGLFGVRGWVKVYSYTRPPDQIFAYPRWQLEGRGTTLELVEGRVQGRGLVARVRHAGGADIDSREQAAALVGAAIRVGREMLETPPAGSYYWADLIGLAVRSGSGAALGTVRALVENGAQDVLVVEDGEIERLIPFVQGPIVEAVDLAAGLIVVTWEPDY